MQLYNYIGVLLSFFASLSNYKESEQISGLWYLQSMGESTRLNSSTFLRIKTLIFFHMDCVLVSLF